MVQDYNDYEEDEGASLAYVERALSAIRRHLVLIALVTVIGTSLGTFYAWSLGDFYSGSAVVQIDPREKSISNVGSVMSDIKGDTPTIESQVELIRSTPLLMKVIDRLNLRKDPEFGGQSNFQLGNQSQSELQPTSVEDLLSRKSDQPSGPQRDYVVANLSQHIVAFRIRNTLLIEIKVFSVDPKKAALIANTLAEVYLEDQIKSKQSVAGLASELLEKKLSSLKDELAKAETNVERFKAKNQIFEDGNLRLGRSELARLMEKTVTARNETAIAKAKFEKAKRLLDSGRSGENIANVLQSHAVALLKEELARARRRHAELATRYGPRHPDMKKSAADVAEAQQQLNFEVKRLVSNISNEFDVAQSREAQLQADLTLLKSRQSQSDEISVELAELKRTAENTRRVYEALLTRYKATAETQNMQLPDVRVVERANIALMPAGPKRKMYVIASFICSLGLILMFVLAREFITPGISRPEDAERIFQVAHLSSLPNLDDRMSVQFSSSYALRMIITEPRSTYSEAIRNIRHELDIGTRSQRSKVIAVASSLPEEGSVAISSNLAHLYALTQNRVLLIDGDIRRASLTRRLAPQRQTGLLETLWHGHAAEHAILRDQSTGLDFLPAMGPSPLEPASPELLASSQMHRLFKELANRYDTIVLDVPPLLPITDGRILAEFADQIVFSIAWRKTPKQLAKRALRLLGPNQKKVAGVVVNKMEVHALEESLGFEKHPQNNPTLNVRTAA